MQSWKKTEYFMSALWQFVIRKVSKDYEVEIDVLSFCFI